jgi:preprotein translocase subunit SecE
MSDRKKTYDILKYVAGLLGFIGILLAIFVVTGAFDWFIIEANIKGIGTLTSQNKLVISLVSSILGIFLLFIAFSKQIDKFFTFLETHKVGKDKNEAAKGVTIETIFFIIIALVLIVIVNLLAIGTLVLRTNLPLLGKATKTVLIISLIILAILSIITAFHRTISRAVKEMKKVHWPTGKEMVEYSKRVFSFIIFFSIFFFALDLVFTNVPSLLERIFDINL